MNLISIAHRGNISGPNKELENRLSQIEKCFDLGLEVEVDIWYVDGWYLGHDAPEEKIKSSWIQSEISKLWLHAKNLEAMSRLSEIDLANFFWHETDARVLTSRGFFWTFPGADLDKRAIAVMPELDNELNWKPEILQNSYGVCTDYPLKYMN